MTTFSLREFPLHGGGLRDSQWWGCSEPERPYDDNECWDERCPGCRIKMEMTLRERGDIPLNETHDGSPRGETIRECLDRSRPT